jgi:SPP1 family predicted phage head-tail adaptor
MRPGKLRHRIIIQSLQKVDDGGGGYTEDWVNIGNVWASVQPLQGRELFQAQQVQAELSHKVRIRYREGIVPSMRVVFNNRIMEIQSVINIDEANREIELLCIERSG